MALTIGVLIGLVLGLTGAGGSVLALPLLVGVLGLGLAESAGLSLGAVALAALTGVLLRWHRQEVLWRPALLLAATGALLTPLGQWLGRQLPAPLLLALFALLALLIAGRLWRQAVRDPAAASITRAGGVEAAMPAAPVCRIEGRQLAWTSPCLRRLLLAGAATGLLSGLFGVGGGFVIVPALVLFIGLDMPRAVATSLAVITLVAGSGFIAFMAAGQLPPVWPMVAAGAFIGMLAGTVLARHLAGPRLQQGFALLIVAMTGLMLWQQLV